uniref:UBR-type domain-containing protein n=1 Tax=Peronospora matthiolae TaxID=2874970 RepID=A0AAV1T6I9_9STRA
MPGEERVDSTKGINGEDEEEEEVVTLSDVLKHNEHMTETADAVLGDASDTHCSYPMGYIRQAVYACMTCTPEAVERPETRAGVCLACTYSCHHDHELVELYTKRMFRCDCGNDKFPSTMSCKLEAEKAPANERNTYSQNYGGLYCNCHRPYPDPERTTADVMVQCVICEDWLHEEHLTDGSNEEPAAEKDASESCDKESTTEESPTSGDADGTEDLETAMLCETFDELVCLDCMKKHPFLMAYAAGSTVERAVKRENTDEGSSEATPASSSECVLKLKQQQQLETKSSTALRPTFWSSDWRSDLCQCSSCVALFEKHGIAFLLDPDDALHVYEASAREKKSASDEEVAQRAFANKLTHEQQVDVAVGYSVMKNNLQQYLAGFAAEGKTVRKEDIQQFFAGLRQIKRQKTE